jgi:hypothetical protein
MSARADDALGMKFGGARRKSGAHGAVEGIVRRLATMTVETGSFVTHARSYPKFFFGRRRARTGFLRESMTG